MKSWSIIGITQFFVVSVLVLVSYFCFSQTSIYYSIVQIIEGGLRILIPSLGSYQQIAQFLLFGLILLIAFLISLPSGNRNVKFLCYFSFLLFLPLTESFSGIDFLSVLGMKRLVTGYVTINQVLFAGISLLFCYLFLICLSRIKETRYELIQRGGNTAEIDLAVRNGILHTFTVILASASLSGVAALFLIFGQPIATALVNGFPYANIILGIGSIFTVTMLAYYFLKEHGGDFNELPIDGINLKRTEKTNLPNLQIPVNPASLRAYMDKKFRILIELGVTADFSNKDNQVIKELSIMGIRTIGELNNIVPDDYIEKQSTLLPTIDEKGNWYSCVLIDLFIIHDAKTFFEKIVGNGYLELRESDLRFWETYSVDVTKSYFNRIHVQPSNQKKKLNIG